MISDELRKEIRKEILEGFRIAHEAVINDPWCDSTESYSRATIIILEALESWKNSLRNDDENRP